MTRGKKANKKKNRNRANPEAEPSTSKRMDERKSQSITAIFKGEELQEIAAHLGVAEPDDSHTLLGAVVLNKFDVVKRLLKEGYSIDSCNEDGMTPLMWSIKLNHWEMIELLIKRGADLHLEDKDGNNPLMIATNYKIWTQDMFIDFLHLVKDYSINLNHTNKSDYTVLHLAVKRNWENVVELLLKNGADANLATNKGVTALMMACSRHQLQSIMALIHHSADLTCEDQKGCTACCYAIAVMMQKKLAMEYTIEQMIAYMRSDNSKLSIKVYLKAIEKHTENNNYVIGLLNILTELVRYCDCCTSHIPFDRVMTAFQEAGIPLVCLRLIKRFANSPSLQGNLQAAFLPLFLTSKQTETKLWLQNNYKAISPYYRIFVQNKSPEYVFYPNELHSQMVHKFSMSFKQLMAQLQTGTPIRPQKKRKEKKCENKKSLQNSNFFKKKCETESDKKDVVPSTEAKKVQKKEEKIIVAVISNKKKEENVKELKEENPTPLETYWPTEKETKNIKPEEDSEPENESAEEIVYPKWKEDFKEGCKLFGIVVTEEETQGQITESKIPQEVNTEIERKLDELETLFNWMLSSYETVWQRDFKDGYKNVNGDEGDCLKLMYNLPNMEYHHWNMVTDKWKELCKVLRLNWSKCNEETLTDLKLYLKSCIEILRNRYQFITHSSSKLFCEQEISGNTISIEEFIRENQKEIHSKKQQDCLSDDNINTCNNIGDNQSDASIVQIIVSEPEKSSSQPMQSIQSFTQEKPSYPEIIVKHSEDNNSEPSKVSQFQINTCLSTGYNKSQIHFEEQEKELHINKENSNNIKMNGYSENDKTFPAKSAKNLDEPFVKYWDDAQIHYPIPPGFFEENVGFRSNEGCQENWRVINFNRNNEKELVDILKWLRRTVLEQGLPMRELIMPPLQLQSQFTIGDCGSFGPVTLALDAISGKPVAVKRLSLVEPSLCRTLRGWRARVLLRRLTWLNSKWLVPYCHCFDRLGIFLFATPLCQAHLDQHLAALKQAGVFTRQKAILLVTQAMSGINYLHSQRPPIIHGNLKPQNMLIDAGGNLRLVDFGLHEVLFQQVCASTSVGVWWSRETYKHYHVDWKLMVTCKSDIQVLGMVSHYILSGGLHPFGRFPAEIVKGIVSNTPILRLDNHEALDIISWMLSKDPERRPTSVQIMEHVFTWSKEKKWKFLMVCAGVPMEGISLSLVLNHFHNSIDKYARQYKLNIKWVEIAEKKLPQSVTPAAFSETVSGLLCFLRENLPASANWFLTLFPSTPFILYRLLDGSPWQSHQDLAQFRAL